MSSFFLTSSFNGSTVQTDDRMYPLGRPELKGHPFFQKKKFFQKFAFKLGVQTVAISVKP